MTAPKLPKTSLITIESGSYFCGVYPRTRTVAIYWKSALNGLIVELTRQPAQHTIALSKRAITLPEHRANVFVFTSSRTKAIAQLRFEELYEVMNFTEFKYLVTRFPKDPRK